MGFVGAIKLAQAQILPKNITILSLETSAPRGSAEAGRGPIIRVGDRISTFDGAATMELLAIAEKAGIAVQRCLLDGGTCEAPAYQLYGYTCAAASIALGNYHNCAPNGTIAAEYVSVSDYINMVQLCLAAALHSKAMLDLQMALRRKIEKNARLYRAFYRS